MNASAPPQKVSVYIPAHNAGEFLERSIKGLLAQSLPPDEILVIDDGSRDNSAEIAAAHKGVTLIRHPVNKGLAAARNTAMKAARNDFVASIDADCIAHPDWLSLLARNMDDPKLAGVGGELIEGVQETLADRWRAVHLSQQWGNLPLRNPLFLFGCNNLFRKSAVVEVGGYDERMRTNGEDTNLCARLRAKGWDLLYDPSARAIHLRHDTIRSVLNAYWRWWRFGVNSYANGARLRSVIGHALFVHFRYNFLQAAQKDFHSSRWSLLGFDFLLLGYLPYRDFCLWLDARSQRSQLTKGV
ncbi:MAG TPA: glycosyltransferase family 2 protein [Candidatus Bathyarchaeia archaeon]|jgi:glycosyltransferase involved in cell wall biosynthesis|nr:glycosyltransferase family 2 protein [Candidatus Bathyarchaeia archaeon]